jgi:hypothetical protein
MHCANVSAVALTFRGAVRRVKRGRRTTFRPRGASMRPLIESGQKVTVEPVRRDALEPGDVVIVEVDEQPMLHLIRSLDETGERAEIAGADGIVNGWTTLDKVHGICTVIDGTPVPGAAGKVRSHRRISVRLRRHGG